MNDKTVIVAGVALVALLLFSSSANAANTNGDIDDGLSANLRAFLKLIQWAEGTFSKPNPYAVCYAYSHTISDFSDHPAITKEWNGVVLPDRICAGAGYGPGCKSTAAGAYQINRPTWLGIKNKLPGIRFDAAGQTAAAIQLIKQRGALQDVENGALYKALKKCNPTWASLPGSPYDQPTRSYSKCEDFYISQGGGVFS